MPRLLPLQCMPLRRTTGGVRRERTRRILEVRLHLGIDSLEERKKELAAAISSGFRLLSPVAGHYSDTKGGSPFRYIEG